MLEATLDNIFIDLLTFGYNGVKPSQLYAQAATLQQAHNRGHRRCQKKGEKKVMQTTFSCSPHRRELTCERYLKGLSELFETIVE